MLFACGQAAYSLGLYILPWFAARFLSTEAPGLFFMGRIVYRCGAQLDRRGGLCACTHACPGLFCF